MNKLNEIEEVIILAAGRSRRMEQLSRKEPKCLLPYKGERVLERLVRQIKENGVKRIHITTGYCANKIAELFKDDPIVETIENKYFEEDVNILSMSLALQNVNGPVVIFEADTIMEDALVKYVLGQDFEGKSVWFTKGRFNGSQYGGILKSDKYGKITDIRIIAAYNLQFKNYSKLSGLMRVGGNEIELFKALINKYAKTTIKQYFLNAWIENIKLLTGYEADISNYKFFTFNKPEEYYQVQNTDIDEQQDAKETELVEVEKLHGIEANDPDRATDLQEKILAEGVWSVPVIVTKGTYLVLDGQHRMEVAKRLGLKHIPAILVDYNDVKVWTLRKEIKVSQKIVEQKVLKKHEIYPYKTVKHKFGFNIPSVSYTLNDLKQ